MTVAPLTPELTNFRMGYQLVMQFSTTLKLLNILLVENNDLIRAGLNHVLNQSGECRVAEQASTLSLAASVLSQEQIDIVLIKFRMPDGLARDFIPDVRREHPDTKILVLLEEEEEFWEALQLDADGFEVRQMPTYQLMAALKAISEGYAWLGPMISRYLLKRGGRDRLLTASHRKPVNSAVLKTLSPRERDVISLLSEGYNGDDISKKLGISPKTVKLHVSSCIRKLHVQDRTQAIAKFLNCRQ